VNIFGTDEDIQNWTSTFCTAIPPRCVKKARWTLVD